MQRPPGRTRAEFDRIARLEEASPAGEGPYLRWLAARLPARVGEALEIGCGTGGFTRLLARRADRVLALDLSPEMVRVARERSRGADNVEYRVEDAARWAFPRERFDVVASVATLHHLALEPTVRKMRDALRPGGLLLVLDVLERPGLRHLPLNAAAWAVSRLRALRPGTRWGRALDDAYREHGRGETYLRPGDLAARYAALLPGARLRTHLLWRYSVVWRKP